MAFRLSPRKRLLQVLILQRPLGWRWGPRQELCILQRPIALNLLTGNARSRRAEKDFLPNKYFPFCIGGRRLFSCLNSARPCFRTQLVKRARRQSCSSLKFSLRAVQLKIASCQISRIKIIAVLDRGISLDSKITLFSELVST